MSEDKFNYKELGLMMGLEIHQQLDSKTKLFCRCPNSLTDKKPERKINLEHLYVENKCKIDTCVKF